MIIKIQQQIMTNTGIRVLNVKFDRVCMKFSSHICDLYDYMRSLICPDKVAQILIIFYFTFKWC